MESILTEFGVPFYCRPARAKESNLFDYPRRSRVFLFVAAVQCILCFFSTDLPVQAGSDGYAEVSDTTAAPSFQPGEGDEGIVSALAGDTGNEQLPEVRYCAARVGRVRVFTEKEKAEAFGTMEPFFTAEIDGTIEDSPYAGKPFSTVHIVQDAIDFFQVRPGDRVILMIEAEPGGGMLAANILEYDRRWAIWLLLGLFVGAVVLLGGFTGVRSLVSLGASVALIFLLFIPQVAKGSPPVPWAMGVCVASTVITFLLTGGFGKKYIAAIFGTLGGLGAAVLLSWVFNGMMRLTGSMHQEIRILFMELGPKFDFGGLLLSGIIIGALGAIMDVAVSISSALFEVREARPDISFKGLMKAGLTIGRDIMGTMTNTLVLAYVGGSLPLILLLMMQKTDYPMVKIINFDLIASEILRSLVGSLGLIMCIPLTALFAGLLFSIGRPLSPDPAE